MEKVNPFDFFDHIYCIHMPKSVEREALVRSEFEKLGILSRIDWVHATQPNPENFKSGGSMYYPAAQVGCKLSHLKALHNAMFCGYQTILILEDDVIFPNWDVTKLETAIEELPEAWDMLYLGGEPVEPTDRRSPSLVQVRKFWGAYAYAVHDYAVAELADLIVDYLTQAGLDGGVYAEYTPFKRCFCVYPPICKTRPNYSTIVDQDCNYDADTNLAWRDFKPET